MAVLYLVQLYVFFAACDDRGSYAVVKLGGVSFKVTELSGCNLCPLMLDELAELVN